MRYEDFSPPSAGFNPTYTGGRLERAFLLESMAEFYDDRLIGDILFKVKGGKEANVYACSAFGSRGGGLLAAKVYRPEAFRAMKNDQLYRLGREETAADGKAIRDSRALRAMHKRTKVGRALRSGSWIQAEYRALCDCYDAGLAVPEPVSMNERVILMSFIGDEDGAAPTLHDVRLEVEEAQRASDALFEQVAGMLELGRIHGDLSAYNVLYHRGEPVVIDLPQCVDPHTHPAAYELLRRDVERLCSYFARCGVERDPAGVTAELWRTRVRR